MSIGAELGHYILQTHNSKNSEDSMGVEPLSPIGTPVRLFMWGRSELNV